MYPKFSMTTLSSAHKSKVTKQANITPYAYCELFTGLTYLHSFTHIAPYSISLIIIVTCSSFSFIWKEVEWIEGIRQEFCSLYFGKYRKAWNILKICTSRVRFPRLWLRPESPAWERISIVIWSGIIRGECTEIPQLSDPEL